MKTFVEPGSKETSKKKVFFQSSNKTKNGEFFQPKLTIGPTDDIYEKEADKVADQVMRMEKDQNVVQTKISQLPLQRKCAECEEEENKMAQRKPRSHQENEAPTEVHQALNSGGKSLDSKTRSFMENRFGYNFDNIKIHADQAAAKSAESINALAYTSGNDIVFNKGQYSPETDTGKKLLAHELTHVVQQNETKINRKIIQRSPLDEDRIHGPILDQFSSDTGIPRDIASQHSPEYRQWLYGITHQGVEFIQPVPVPENPLTRLGRGQSPGLTTPTINGNVMQSSQDVLNEVTPTSVQQTGTSGGNVACQFSRNFKINTSANVIVANSPGPTGWTDNIAVAAIGNPQQCTGVANVPATMSALPSNASFVTRVGSSEQEHVDAIRGLHERHLVPYHRFIMGLNARGPNLNDCAQNLVGQLNNRHLQAAFGFLFGYAAETERLDSPVGTHADTANAQVDQACSSASLILSQTNAPIPGSGLGNVVTINPTTLNFTPATLTVSGNRIMDGANVVKSLASNAEAQSALNVIRHYGMNSRHTVGSFEYFLVNGNSPVGPLAGLDEFNIDPDYYQVSLGIPGHVTDWIITDFNRNNINVIWNFGNNRDQAYSALSIMKQFRFTQRAWVGGTRSAPSMLFFRR